MYIRGGQLARITQKILRIYQKCRPARKESRSRRENHPRGEDIAVSFRTDSFQICVFSSEIRLAGDIANVPHIVGNVANFLIAIYLKYGQQVWKEE